MSRSIDRRWLPLNALRAFEGVARHGTFTAAAQALLTSQSALSRHVIALERLLGQQLFERRPHALVLTKVGQYLLPVIGKSFDRLEHALDAIRNEGEPGQRTLRVQMPPSFAVRLAVPMLHDFRQINSEVEIDLVSPAGAGGPLAECEVAVIYAKPTVTDLVADLLWPVHLTIMCHPELAARHAGASLEEFIERNELIHVRIPGEPRHQRWTEFMRQEGLKPVSFERGIVFDTAVLAVEYALAGQGLALVDPNLFAEELRGGRLVRPFDVALDDGYGYYLITHPEDLSDTAIAMFLSWLIERFQHRPNATPPQVRLAVSNE